MANRRDIQFTFNPHNRATVLDCSFKVAHTDAAGLGITGLNKSGRIANVFMNTNQTPGVGSGNITNPNPQAGVILVQMQDNYNTFLNVMYTIRNPLSGSNISTGLSTGNVYVITLLSATTAAQWQTAGVPSYITPAVGVAFIAAATSVAGGGKVQALASSGVTNIEKIGSATVMNSNGANVSGGGIGMSLMLGCMNPAITMASYTPAGTITNGSPDTFAGTPAVLTGTNANALAAPTDGTIIHLYIYLNNSAQGV